MCQNLELSVEMKQWNEKINLRILKQLHLIDLIDMMKKENDKEKIIINFIEKWILLIKFLRLFI
jgi:hypothetical protein